MPQDKDQESRRFWRLTGLALVGAAVLVLLYVLIGPGFSKARWSDALCMSALLLGVGSSVPFLFDAGRGLTIPEKMRGDTDDRRAAWHAERAKREKGMTITFALALAALLVGLLSLLTSLW